MNTSTSIQSKEAAAVLYGGEIVLRFDRKSHSYEVTEKGETREVPSVTRILKVVDKSEPLVQWSANCAADLLAERLQPGQTLTKAQIACLCAAIRFAHRGVSGRAKSVGTLAHGWIEQVLRLRMAGEYGEPPLPVNPQARHACLAARDWLAAHHFEPLAAEQVIYSRAHRYAGTLDVAAMATIDGRFSIIDWKTSAAIYPEYRLQLAAYAQAIREMEGQPRADRWIVRLGKNDGAFETVHIGSEDQDRDFRVFLAAKDLLEGITELRWTEANATALKQPSEVIQ